MLYHLLYPLRDLWFGLNVFKYITFRAAMASITAFLFSVIIGPIIIRKLSNLKVGELPRKKHVENLYELHKHKEGTPTMGGIIIILSIVLSVLLWAKLDNRLIILCLITVVWLGIVGFVDDYIKLIKLKSLGLSATTKFVGQLVLALGVAVYLYFDPEISRELYIPFMKHAVINLGIFYILFILTARIPRFTLNNPLKETSHCWSSPKHRPSRRFFQDCSKSKSRIISRPKTNNPRIH